MRIHTKGKAAIISHTYEARPQQQAGNAAECVAFALLRPCALLLRSCWGWLLAL